MGGVPILYPATGLAISELLIVSIIAMCVECHDWERVREGGLAMNTSVQQLPDVLQNSSVSIEHTIARRRSVRSYDKTRVLTDQEIAQLCWAAQGITEPKEGLRATPSAGACYPIEVLLVTAEGVSRYLHREHALETHTKSDMRKPLQKASLDQEMICDAPITMVVAAVLERIEQKYGQWAEQYTLIEVGHLAQNVLLQAESLGLAGCPVAAFEEDKVIDILTLPTDHRVYYLIPLGQPA